LKAGIVEQEEAATAKQLHGKSISMATVTDVFFVTQFYL
jgi:hypothetical protein